MSSENMRDRANRLLADRAAGKNVSDSEIRHAQEWARVREEDERKQAVREAERSEQRRYEELVRMREKKEKDQRHKEESRARLAELHRQRQEQHEQERWEQEEARRQQEEAEALVTKNRLRRVTIGILGLFQEYASDTTQLKDEITSFIEGIELDEDKVPEFHILFLEACANMIANHAIDNHDDVSVCNLAIKCFEGRIKIIKEKLKSEESRKMEERRLQEERKMNEARRQKEIEEKEFQQKKLRIDAVLDKFPERSSEFKKCVECGYVGVMAIKEKKSALLKVATGLFLPALCALPLALLIESKTPFFLAAVGSWGYVTYTSMRGTWPLSPKNLNTYTYCCPACEKTIAVRRSFLEALFQEETDGSSLRKVD